MYVYISICIYNIPIFCSLWDSNPTAACVCCMFSLICLRSPFQRGERPLPMAGLLGRWKVRVPGGLDEVALQQESYKKADHATWSKESIQIHCMVRERQGELISVVWEGFASNYQSQFWNPNSILPSHQQVFRVACGKCTLTFGYSRWARTAQGFLACSMLRCLPLLPPPTSLHLGTTTCNPHLLVGCMVPWQEVERLGSFRRSQEGIPEWFCLGQYCIAVWNDSWLKQRFFRM